MLLSVSRSLRELFLGPPIDVRLEDFFVEDVAEVTMLAVSARVEKEEGGKVG